MSETTLDDVVAELRAIRELLEGQAMCPHGSTGICMACVMPLVDYHLTQMAQTVSNNVWEAVRTR
jgi:hypothetical protein